MTILNKLKHLFSFIYHLRISADLHGNITSRIADADHQHPLASVSIWIFVVPAVNAFSWEVLVSWRDQNDLNGKVTFPVWNDFCHMFQSPHTWELPQRRRWINKLTRTHQNCIEHVLLFLAVAVHRHDVPLTRPRKVRSLSDPRYRRLKQAYVSQSALFISSFTRTTFYLKTDVSKQVKALRIEPEILLQLRVVQVIWVGCRHGEITETHHLLTRVGHQRTIDARSPWLRWLLEAWNMRGWTYKTWKIWILSRHVINTRQNTTWRTK